MIIRRLHRFVIETFIPIFLMTFLISLFILLMQFLWKHVNEMVGKGVTIDILGEFFFYAAASLVPTALPLAVLVGSLMTFGNLGERLELLAMKAAGISLIRIMAPLIILVTTLGISSFFYQDYIVPKAQVNMWSLLFSMKQKSPELDIPERIFYDQIPGYNMYVQKKNPQTGVLYQVMIYDFSAGFENSSVLVADSATLHITKDKKYLFLNLFHGEGFENLKKQQINLHNVPYRREKFSDKQILIEFDVNFSRMSSEVFQGQYVGMKLNELNHAADSLRIEQDSIKKMDQIVLKDMTPLTPRYQYLQNEREAIQYNQQPNNPTQIVTNIDSLLSAQKILKRQQIVVRMKELVNQTKQELEFRAMTIDGRKRAIARFELEWHRKFVLSFACIVFFFVGGSLGAIIRKGGFGLSAVVSVFIFIFYYMIDITGYKLARDVRTEAWIGMWLSTIVVTPIGIFITYKAMKDAVVLNFDNHLIALKRWLRKKEKRQLNVTSSNFTLEIDTIKTNITEINNRVEMLIPNIHYTPSYVKFWKEENQYIHLEPLTEEIDNLVRHLQALRQPHVTRKLIDYPMISTETFSIIPTNRTLRKCCAYILPIGALLYWHVKFHNKALLEELRTIQRVNQEVNNILE